MGFPVNVIDILFIKEVAGAESKDFVGEISFIFNIGNRDGLQNIYTIKSSPSIAYQVPKNGNRHNTTQPANITIISQLASKIIGQLHTTIIKAIIVYVDQSNIGLNFIFPSVIPANLLFFRGTDFIPSDNI